jgi:hypothetical protein
VTPGPRIGARDEPRRTVCDHLQVVALKAGDLGPALRDLRARAATPAGQAVGVALILVPAVVHPVPMGAADATVEVLAAVAGALGALVVFGGLFQWVFLTPRPDADGAPPAVPHARAAWAGAVVLAVLLAAAAVWRLVVVLGDEEAGRLSEVVLLGLPAIALAWAAWAARGVWRDDEAPGPR